MLKNTTTGQILIVERVDIYNNTALIYYSNDAYASNKTYSNIDIPNLQYHLNQLGDNTKTKLENIIYAAELGILEVIGENWIENGHVEWKYPDWDYRFYCTHQNVTFLTNNYFEYVISLKTEPVNPTETFSEGILIYIDTLHSELNQLFEQLGITLENKPV